MSKKSEGREQRKALKQQKFDEQKANFLQKVGVQSQPKILELPAQSTTPRMAPHLEREAEAAAKVPKTIVDGSRFSHLVTWCITKADRTHSWPWNEPRAWAEEEWTDEIHPAFTAYEKLTWREIDLLSSEAGHKMHHDHELTDLVAEAQARWKELNLEQFDTVFRFRLGGRKRAWGFVVQAHFHFVWWDRTHAIYPVR